MTPATLIEIFERDLLKLKQEIGLYPDDASLWMVQEGISNSAGNLCLHLTGNLNHFIGAVLGENGYVRDRPGEFNNKDIPRSTLYQQIDDTIQMIKEVLGNLSATDLEKTYPIDVMRENMTTEFFLTHLTTHFAYHLGQINYHRRLLA